MHIELRTLGAYACLVDGREVPAPATLKARALLAFLATNRQPHARERLAELFWPEADVERSRGNLKTALWSIRRSLAAAGNVDELLVVDRTFVTLACEVAFDAATLLEPRALSDPEARRAAIAAYRGDFLDGDFCDWALAQRERLGLRYEELLTRELAEAPDATVAESLLARDPYSECAYEVLVDAALAARNSRAAAAAYRRCAEALAEVGREPSAALYAKVERNARSSDTASRHFVVPFVGRSDELTAMERLAADSRAGRGGAIVVSGAAGIGKSALLQHAAERARRQGCTVTSIRGRLEENVAFGIWGDLYRERCGHEPEELAQAGGAAPAVLATSLATTFGAAHALVIDDVQFMSGLTRAITLDVAGRAVAAGAAVVLGCRPEARSDLERDLAIVAPVVLPLDVLSKHDIDVAIRRAAGSPMPELAALLAKRTGGYPLFLQGLCAALVNDGRLARDPNRWTLDAGASTTLPSDVRALYRARLRERGDDALRVATALALEPALPTGDLAEIVGTGEPHVLDALDDLLALGILEEAREGPELRFVHDVIRDVAASEVSHARRATMHRAIAACLGRAKRTGMSARQAEHALAAGEPFEASTAFLDAAREATRFGAFEDALRLAGDARAALAECRRAREATEHRIEVELIRKRAYAELGQVDEALQCLSDALHLSGELGNHRQACELYLARSAYYNQINGHRIAEDDAREGMRRADELGEPAFIASAFYNLAAALSGQHESASALAAAREGFTYAERHGLWRHAAGCATWAAHISVQQECLDEADRWARLGVEVAMRSGTRDTLDARYARASVLATSGQFDESVRELRAVLAALDDHARSGEIGRRSDGRLRFVCEMGLVSVARSRHDWQRMVEGYERLANDRWSASCPAFLARTHVNGVLGLVGRGLPGDIERAAIVASTFFPDDRSDGGYAEVAANVARALVGIATGSPNARTLGATARSALLEHEGVRPTEARPLRDAFHTVSAAYGSAEFDDSLTGSR